MIESVNPSLSIVQAVRTNEQSITNAEIFASGAYALGWGLVATGVPLGLLFVGLGVLTQGMNIGAILNQHSFVSGIAKSSPESLSLHNEYAQARQAPSAWNVAAAVTTAIGFAFRAPEFVFVGALGFLLSAALNHESKTLLEAGHTPIVESRPAPASAPSPVLSAALA